jgi:hypothetical protein
MAKYYTYQGKKVGFVRKMVDDVILIEEAWVNEVRVHLAKNGYDSLLGHIAKILAAGGHPPVTRAQAWIILKDLLADEIPDVLQNKEADEVSTKGNLFALFKNTAASTADAIVTPVGKTVGGGINAVSKIVKKEDKEGQ